MIQTIIICIAVVAISFILSNAKITITLNHNYPQPPVDKVDNTELEKDIKETYDKDNTPSMDDILKAVHEIVGGEDDDTTT